jgi:hypothetical protein
MIDKYNASLIAKSYKQMPNDDCLVLILCLL